MSKKGVKQSIALGKKLLKNSIYFDQIIIGPLNRHQQTFDGINQGYGGNLSDPLIIEEFAENQLMDIAQHFIPKMLNTDKNIKEIFNSVPFWKRKRKLKKKKKNGFIMNLIYLKKVLKVMMHSEKEFELQKVKYPP